MHPSNEQVVALFESGMEPEEIHEAMEGQVALVAIKLALMNGSALYREKQKIKKELFNDDDLESSARVIKGLMFSADSDVVKFRAAMLIHDEKTGKRNIKNNVRNVNFSMTLINQEFAASEKAIEMAKSKKVEIEDRHKHLKDIAV